MLLALVFVLAAWSIPRSGSATTAILDQHLIERLATAPADEQIGVILTYDDRPGDPELAQLEALGALVVAFRHLPLAAALATPAQIEEARTLPGVRAVYLNRPLQFYLRESVPLIGASEVWQHDGATGKGIGIAILDTGLDATHPDLALGSTTRQNVKILGLQFAAGQNLTRLDLPLFYLEDQLNTDTTSGHGTHVAGIAGASGAASNGYYRGVAPGAQLVGLGAGEAIEIFTALAGFDYILEHRERYNIRVVNCSWGDTTPGFDPEHPVNRATQTLHDAGITVVFAAGNAGSTTDTLNTYSVAPWVIGVAAGEKDGQTVAFFSSRGIPGDDFFHPTLTAPGYLIVSDRTATGAAVNVTSTTLDPIFVHPDYLHYYTTASGTSMAAPHVAGAVALMLEANSSLTPDVVKRVLINTATPMPQFQEYAAGAGYLNARAAVETARSIKHIRSYRDPRTGKDEQVYDLTKTWEGTVAASLPGLPSVDQQSLVVQQGTISLDIAIDWDLVASDLDLYLYAPDGTLAAQSMVVQSIYGYANETAHVDSPAPGTWLVEVRGMLNAPQPYRGTANAVVLVNP
ncbi:MAG: hypothetical protein KatS3mg057_0142 [Herpetosiphonaceae bacterium]|nr:MAG: hypothetical protein KatS3mg057_0142 [Herpetosiphonaceae bacterium]